MAAPIGRVRHDGSGYLVFIVLMQFYDSLSSL